MESDSKVVAADAESTNHMSVVDKSIILSDSAAKEAKGADRKADSEDKEDRDRKRRRKDDRDSRSRERSHRRSHRDRSSSKDGRRRSSDRHRRHDRDRDRERTKEHVKEDDKDKEKDRKVDKTDEKEGDKDVRASRSDKGRDRERDRDRDYHRDRDRDRDNRGRSVRDRDDRDRRDRDRERRRNRSRSPGYQRGRDSRRRSRSHSSDGGRHRSRARRSRSRSASKKRTAEEDNEPGKPKPISLRDIIAANPGISVPEAAVRLNAYNTAVARGQPPPPLSAPIQGAPVAHGVIPGIPAPVGGMPVPTIPGLVPPIPTGPMGEGGAATKAQRELYVGNLPPGITVPQLAEFLNTAFKQLNLCKDPTQNTVITAWVSTESHYAFVELRTIDEATAALTYLNGIQVGNFNLKFGRPKGYTGGVSSLAVPMQSFNNPVLTSAALGSAVGLGAQNPLLAGLSNLGGMGMIGLGGAEGMSNVIMVTNLPSLISEQQIRELFTPFGELKAFNTIKTAGGQSQSAVLEYENPDLTDGVIGGMNNLDIAGQKLSVQRVPASSAAVLLQSTTKPAPPSEAPPAPANGSITSASSTADELADVPPSSVIRMSNMTTEEDLTDDQCYEELMEDVADECNSHGTVKSIVIPRTGTDSSVGKIFVHFVDASSAQASRKAVAGRKFNGRVVEAYFYPEELFLQKIYCLPVGYLNGTSNGNAISGHSNSVTNSTTATTKINVVSSVNSADLNDIDEGEHPTVTVATVEAVVEQSFDPAPQDDLD